MPQPQLLKLCPRCDQVSVLSSPREKARCSQPFAGGRCWTRATAEDPEARLQLLTVHEFNTLRALEKATYEGRIGDLEAEVARQGQQLNRLEDLVRRLDR